MNNKQLARKQLIWLRNRYIAIIYSGLVNAESVKKLHQKLLRETINAKKHNQVVSLSMLNQARYFVEKTKYLKPNKERLEYKYGSLSGATLLPIFAFDVIKKLKVEKHFQTNITDETNEIENKGKEIALGGIIDEARNNKLVFFLASQHQDSAKDHKDYQGKMYVDEKWQSVIKDSKLKEKVRNYINQHNVKTIQWVTGKPVWFVTRPNCRHFFQALSISEVLGNSINSLLVSKDMKRAVGNRAYLQTMKRADAQNVKFIIDRYKERLKMHQEMYNEVKSNVLKQAIDKDIFLIKKWEAVLNGQNKKK